MEREDCGMRFESQVHTVSHAGILIDTVYSTVHFFSVTALMDEIRNWQSSWFKVRRRCPRVWDLFSGTGICTLRYSLFRRHSRSTSLGTVFSV